MKIREGIARRIDGYEDEPCSIDGYEKAGLIIEYLKSQNVKIVTYPLEGVYPEIKEVE